MGDSSWDQFYSMYKVVSSNVKKFLINCLCNFGPVEKIVEVMQEISDIEISDILSEKIIEYDINVSNCLDKLYPEISNAMFEKLAMHNMKYMDIYDVTNLNSYTPDKIYNFLLHYFLLKYPEKIEYGLYEFLDSEDEIALPFIQAVVQSGFKFDSLEIWEIRHSCSAEILDILWDNADNVLPIDWFLEDGPNWGGDEYVDYCRRSLREYPHAIENLEVYEFSKLLDVMDEETLAIVSRHIELTPYIQKVLIRVLSKLGLYIITVYFLRLANEKFINTKFMENMSVKIIDERILFEAYHQAKAADNVTFMNYIYNKFGQSEPSFLIRVSATETMNILFQSRSNEEFFSRLKEIGEGRKYYLPQFILHFEKQHKLNEKRFCIECVECEDNMIVEWDGDPYFSK